MSEAWVHVVEPALIKQICVKSFDSFNAHYFEQIEKRFKTLDQVNGAEWRDLRRGLSPTFTSGKIRGMLGLIGGAVDNMVDHLLERTQQDTLVEVKDVFQCLTLDVICKFGLFAKIIFNNFSSAKCAFGIESNSFKNPNNPVLEHGRKIFSEFLISTPLLSVISNIFMCWEKFSKILDMNPPSFTDMWNITKQIQTERERTGSGPGDFIDRLNELTSKVEAGEFPALSKDQITGQVLDNTLVTLVNCVARASCSSLRGTRPRPARSPPSATTSPGHPRAHHSTELQLLQVP